MYQKCCGEKGNRAGHQLAVGGVRIWDDKEPDMRFEGVNDLSFLHAGYETLVLSLN